MKKIFSVVMLALLSTGMLALSLDIQPARASGTIFIRADGSIDPPTAPISTSDYITYTFTANIASDADGIVIERDNIVIDGSGYTLQGSGSAGYGICTDKYDSAIGVTIRNVSITNFFIGIYFFSSSNLVISNVNVTDNSGHGIFLPGGSNINITSNVMTRNYFGVEADGSSIFVAYNIITDNEYGVGVMHLVGIVQNEITHNSVGIALNDASAPGVPELMSFSGNNIADNGIAIYGGWFKAAIYHNNFIDNAIVNSLVLKPNNISWHAGYPSGGNYWSDYTGVDANGDGIGDTPHVIDADNTDPYPLMNPWMPPASTGNITKGGQTYNILFTTNATVLSLTETPGSIKVDLSGETGTTGYVSIIQPAGLNSSNIKVFVNNTKLTFPSTDPPRSITTNGTHYFIYFSVTFNSYWEIGITFPVWGDINYDGTVNILDSIMIGNCFLATPSRSDWNAHADLNDDFVINILDSIIVGNHFLEHF